MEEGLSRLIRGLYARGMEPYEIYDVLRRKGEEIGLDDVFAVLSRLVSPTHYEPKCVFLSRWFFLRSYFMSGMRILADLKKQYDEQKKKRSALTAETAQMIVSVLRDLFGRLKDMWAACRQAMFDADEGEYEFLPRRVAEIFALQAKGLTLSQIAELWGCGEDDVERLLTSAVRTHRLVRSFFVATLDAMASKLREEIYVAAEMFGAHYRDVLPLRELLNRLDSFVYDVRRAAQRRGGIMLGVSRMASSERAAEERREEERLASLFRLFGDRARILSSHPLVFEVDVRGTTWTAQRLLDVVVRSVGALGVVVEARRDVLRFEEREDGFEYPNQLGDAIRRIVVPYADSIEEIRTTYPPALFPEAVREKVRRMRGNKLHTKIVLREDRKIINDVKRIVLELEEAEMHGREVMLFTVGV